ncbi:MAG TPA: DUF58 domain-containing protein [Actinomycetota bacterium]|jgi:uncharacterized protein (DUF58 family)|nr:DUF58 domain-containing protein [Actinomycetota bacterium]
MPSGRGLVVFGAGLAMWVAARIVGSSGIEVVGIGLVALPFIAGLFVRWGRTKLRVRRRLSDVRVPPGTRVTVQLDVGNEAPVPSPFLLIEDRIPAALGRPARLVVSGLPARDARQVGYTVLPQRRGRYRLGPLTVDVSDPFALTRQRLEFDEMEDLLVTPEIEDLLAAPDSELGPNWGATRARQLFRTGEEYYTMRQYQLGDDLRRIHWPSVARTGDLMIRQDESSKRASGLVFLDNRGHALGQSHSPAFERAVSVAATLGVLLAQRGFSLRFGTTEAPPAAVGEDRFLDALAGISHASARSVGPSLAHLRTGASADTSLVYVAAPPAPGELSSLIRAGAGFGPKLAVLVHPVDPLTLPPGRAAQLEGRATQATMAFARAGWDCIVLTPSTPLKDRWHAPRERPLARSV